MVKALTTLFLLLWPLFTLAQKTVRVDAEYTYSAPSDVTLEQAKLTALERAKLQAIADKFGTVVTQHNTTHVENSNGQSTTEFSSIGGSEVKGEWVETLGEPVYTVSYEQEMLIVKVSVSGRIRRINSSAPDLKVEVLRNGTDSKYEADRFRSGDDLFLRFQSPVDGFLLVYLVNYLDGNVYRLLPYSGSAESSTPICHDKPYLFFSAKEAERNETVDEYTMTCGQNQEQNLIMLIFSSNQLTGANTAHGADATTPRMLSIDEFNRWITATSSNDEKLQTIKKYITITK